MKRTLVRGLLGTAALLIGLGAPAMAQEAEMGPRPSVDRLPDTRTPETVPAGRQMGGPEGDALAKPADPTIPTTGPSSNPDRQNREIPAANTQIPPESPQEAAPDLAEEEEEANAPPRQGIGSGQAATPAPLDIAPGENILGTRGGAGLAANQEYAQGLERYKLHGPDGEELGSIEKVVLNLADGRVEGLQVSRSGEGLVGSDISTVAWEHIAEVDKNDRRLVLHGGPEAMSGGGEAEELPRGSEFAGTFAGARVIGADGEELGEVAGVVVNLETGRIDTLMLGAGGFLGIGDKIFDIPWEQVAAVNPQEETVRLAVGQEFLRPNPEYGEADESRTE